MQTTQVCERKLYAEKKCLESVFLFLSKCCGITELHSVFMALTLDSAFEGLWKIADELNLVYWSRQNVL